jgi:ubiquitin-protein ligase
MQCRHGHEYEEGSSFCPMCGESLQPPPPPPPPPALGPRARRLSADYAALAAAFAGHPAVTITPVPPTPPERYRVVYNVPALALAPDRRPHRVHQTIVDIFLPPEYPREKPYLTTSYPVFHPNFGAHVCIADYWSPSQSLVDIVVEVGDMLQWRVFNVRSPLNAVAANWSAENAWQLPVGNVDVMPLRDDTMLLGRVRERSAGEDDHEPRGRS